MGLLDIDMSTPEGQGFNSALMQAAAMLLTPRARGGGIGSAFAAMPQAIERAKAQAQRSRYMDMQAQQMGLQGRKLESDMAESERKRQEDEAQRARMAQLIAGLPPELQTLAQLDPKAVVGSMLPKPQQPSEIDQLTAKLESMPADHPFRKFYQDRLNKLTTHAPAPSQNVYTGTMVPGEVDGKPAFLMPSKSGEVKVVEGISPAGTAEAQSKEKMRKDAAIRSAEIVIGKVDDALSKVGMLTTGPAGAVLGEIPGTEAYNLRRAAETIKANLGFNQLQEMRNLSPTGGALGQVAVQELAMLQAAVSNLDPNQSPGELTKNLQEVRTRYSNVLKILRGEQLGAKQGGATGSFDVPKVGAVVDGYRFKGGNPADQANWEKQ